MERAREEEVAGMEEKEEDEEECWCAAAATQGPLAQSWHQSRCCLTLAVWIHRSW